jgi:colanic acid/amylovoran biosynthesis glycosyltransferase
MPFRGNADEAREAIRAVTSLRTRSGDELIVVDNGDDAESSRELASEAGERVVVVSAAEVASSYYARNAGAKRARSEWLLFMDSDCRPRPDLLDEYFREPVPADCGAMAGDVLPIEDGSLLGGWAASRAVLRQEGMPEDTPPAAVSANLLVRRRAWEAVGGFLEGVRSGGDVDFCWRIQDAGWTLGFRFSASVEHPHRGTLRELMRQMTRYGAGNAWLRRRYGESPLRAPDVAGLLRGLAGALVWLLALQPRRAAYKAIDVVAIASGQVGYLRSNGPRWKPQPPGGLVVMADSYAASTETFVTNEVRQLAELGETVRVESILRPQRQLVGASGFAQVAYLEDEGMLERGRSLVWLIVRHPVAALRELAGGRRWDRRDRVSLPGLALAARRLNQGGERHLHAHFATASAVSARRLGRIRRVPYSVTAHGFDVWVDPRNLPEKLTPAAFVTSGCEYNVRHLRGLLGDEAAGRVHEIVMGVDPERFRRAAAQPTGHTVAAVGRLVEKKGFAYLIEAAARLDAETVHRVLLVGDGPLRTDLERLAHARGVGDRVAFLGSMDPEGVREVLDSADLLAMPCVVAADGDRDSMPVVVKEAMAMEIPVVATDEVGLGEAVGVDRGRLVPPRDAASLAAAIEEILRLGPADRAAMGRAGREWVLENATLELQARRLLALIGSGDAGP